MYLTKYEIYFKYSVSTKMTSTTDREYKTRHHDIFNSKRKIEYYTFQGICLYNSYEHGVHVYMHTHTYIYTHTHTHTQRIATYMYMCMHTAHACMHKHIARAYHYKLTLIIERASEAKYCTSTSPSCTSCLRHGINWPFVMELHDIQRTVWLNVVHNE